MATAIKVENLSKIYRLGEISTGTISRDIERFVKTKILKQDDPFLKIGETNDRATKGASDIVYSLKDINFEIEQGDAVGIIGRNGAGKSTLLKILSRVTSPTTGKINIKGRVASLLEVGTGFHPELTGRENIYLNGAILGMRKREIDRKLDEIIDFSGVERYIDTPVKRYSSGMYVRLAFAVAAHLESEILIVDEVLAVGDAEFQKKCLGKMGEVSKGEGRTVLFVSHNLESISKLCNHSILMQNGRLENMCKTEKIIRDYISERSLTKSISKLPKIFIKNIVEVSEIQINNQSSSQICIKQGEEWSFSFKVKNINYRELNLFVNIELKTLDGFNVGCFGNQFQNGVIEIKKLETCINFNIGHIGLKKGKYSINFYIQVGAQKFMDHNYVEDFCILEVQDSTIPNSFWRTYIDQDAHGYNPIIWSNLLVN
jgi:lipopolysaccharide transport system ATP-binding protein